MVYIEKDVREICGGLALFRELNDIPSVRRFKFIVSLGERGLRNRDSVLSGLRSVLGLF